MSNISSMKPYLMRAIYEWCVDNGFTPYISVLEEGCTGIPENLFAENKVTLNISMQSVNNLLIDNESIQFLTRFSGVEKRTDIDIEAVVAIFARESGQGFTFITETSAEKVNEEAVDADNILSKEKKEEKPTSARNKRRGKVTLKVVK